MNTILDMLKTLEKRGVPIFRRKNGIDAGNGIIDFVPWNNPVFFDKQTENEMRDMCIALLYKRTFPLKEIASRFCISVGMVKYILRKEGLFTPVPARPIEARERARKMALMSLAGVTTRDIAKHFDISSTRAGQVIANNKYARAYIAGVKNRNADKLAAHDEWLRTKE